MSVQKINVLVSPTHRLAPGAAWIADALADMVLHATARIDAWRRRAAEQSAARRFVREQGELQAMATRYMATQPSFAKELLHASMKERGD
jgi:hypothetical protein